MPRTIYRIPDSTKAEIIRQYTTRLADGTWKGGKMIAADLGIADTTVYNVLKEADVPIRSAQEAHAHGKRCSPIKNLRRFTETPPLCKCGCGESAPWRAKRNQWGAYIPAHRYKDASYKEEEWLRDQYVGMGRSAQEIASDFGIHQTSVLRYLRRFGIEIRDASASKIGRFTGDKNPAWKGGIAKWTYASSWKRIAHAIRKRDAYTCQECKAVFPKTSRYLHVHHIDGDKTNNDPANLITYCAKCHPKGKRKEQFNKLSDPHYRTKWLITRKSGVFGIDADAYLTTVEAGQRLNVTPATVAKMIQRGCMEGQRIGWFWYAERASVEQLAQHYRNPKRKSPA